MQKWTDLWHRRDKPGKAKDTQTRPGPSATEAQPWVRSDCPGLPSSLTDHPGCSYFSEGPFPQWLPFPSCLLKVGIPETTLSPACFPAHSPSENPWAQVSSSPPPLPAVVPTFFLPHRNHRALQARAGGCLMDPLVLWAHPWCHRAPLSLPLGSPGTEGASACFGAQPPSF